MILVSLRGTVSAVRAPFAILISAKIRWLKLLVIAFGLPWLSTVIPPASAALIDIALDPNSSVLHATGRYMGFVELIEQGPGSSTTNYRGTITIDVDDPIAPADIRFVGSAIIADNSGDWLPESGGGLLGDPGLAEPADYGMYLEVTYPITITAWVALRDTVFSISSESLPVIAQEFSPQQTIEVASGVIDFNIVIPGRDSAGSDSQVGQTAANESIAPGEYVVDGVTARLALPIEFTFWEGDRDVTFQGVFVGSAQIALSDGDFDEDGNVDGGDFVAWQSGFGILEGAQHSSGDADADGDVDGHDFLTWQSQFGGLDGHGSLAETAIPESPSAAMAFVGLAVVSCAMRWLLVSTRCCTP